MPLVLLGGLVRGSGASTPYFIKHYNNYFMAPLQEQFHILSLYWISLYWSSRKKRVEKERLVQLLHKIG